MRSYPCVNFHLSFIFVDVTKLGDTIAMSKYKNSNSADFLFFFYKLFFQINSLKHLKARRIIIHSGKIYEMHLICYPGYMVVIVHDREGN